MDAVHNNARQKKFFSPSTITELFSSWKQFPQAVPFAGGTSFSLGNASKKIEIPDNILSMDRIHELYKITRTERYIEIGAMVRLNDLIRIGKVVPAILRDTVKQIANAPVRNLSTIGGNICYSKQKLNTHAPLAALDAMFELRTAASTRWIAASRFDIKEDPTSALNSQEILTRIRIPLENWDYTIFKKFERRDIGGSENTVFVFIAKAQKNIISDARLVFSGESIIRNRNLETILAGQQLPLDRKIASHFVELWEHYLTELSYPEEFLSAKILNFIRLAIQDMTL